jgi:hypothetical protein
MRPIRLWMGLGHVAYTEFDGKRSWVTGGYPPAGFIHAARCEDCCGVRVFAVPNERSEADGLPIPAEELEAGNHNLPLPSEEEGEK